ncbi:MAG: sigma-70 family RNA polymerase sigma factor [Myxococcales bacterium]|nr:sigma-70 family RNA polymerase sigma factor [Myxococcales bacterium]
MLLHTETAGHARAESEDAIPTALGLLIVGWASTLFDRNMGGHTKAGRRESKRLKKPASSIAGRDAKSPVTFQIPRVSGSDIVARVARVARSTAEAAKSKKRKESRPQELHGSSEKEKSWASDRELVDEILSGNLEPFNLLYEAYFPRVFRFAMKRLGDAGEAEDVTQEVFIILLKALPSFQGQSSLLVWIFGITRNTVNRRFRKVRPILQPLESGSALDVAGPEAPADERADARRMLVRCDDIIENELTPLQRRIFHLKHLRRLSIRAIADALDKSEDAIKANLYRMRRVLSDGTPGLEPLIRG